MLLVLLLPGASFPKILIGINFFIDPLYLGPRTAFRVIPLVDGPHSAHGSGVKPATHWAKHSCLKNAPLLTPCGYSLEACTSSLWLSQIKLTISFLSYYFVTRKSKPQQPILAHILSLLKLALQKMSYKHTVAFLIENLKIYSCMTVKLLETDTTRRRAAGSKSCTKLN